MAFIPFNLNNVAISLAPRISAGLLKFEIQATVPFVDTSPAYTDYCAVSYTVGRHQLLEGEVGPAAFCESQAPFEWPTTAVEQKANEARWEASLLYGSDVLSTEEFAYRPLATDGIWATAAAVPGFAGEPHRIRYDSKLLDLTDLRNNCIARDGQTLAGWSENDVNGYTSHSFSWWVCGTYRASCSESPDAPFVSTCAEYKQIVLVSSTSTAAAGIQAARNELAMVENIGLLECTLDECVTDCDGDAVCEEKCGNAEYTRRLTLRFEVRAYERAGAEGMRLYIADMEDDVHVKVNHTNPAGMPVPGRTLTTSQSQRITPGSEGQGPYWTQSIEVQSKCRNMFKDGLKDPAAFFREGDQFAFDWQFTECDAPACTNATKLESFTSYFAIDTTIDPDSITPVGVVVQTDSEASLYKDTVAVGNEVGSPLRRDDIACALHKLSENNDVFDLLPNQVDICVLDETSPYADTVATDHIDKGCDTTAWDEYLVANGEAETNSPISESYSLVNSGVVLNANKRLFDTTLLAGEFDGLCAHNASCYSTCVRIASGILARDYQDTKLAIVARGAVRAFSNARSQTPYDKVATVTFVVEKSLQPQAERPEKLEYGIVGNFVLENVDLNTFESDYVEATMLPAVEADEATASFLYAIQTSVTLNTAVDIAVLKADLVNALSVSPDDVNVIDRGSTPTTMGSKGRGSSAYEVRVEVFSPVRSSAQTLEAGVQSALSTSVAPYAAELASPTEPKTDVKVHIDARYLTRKRLNTARTTVFSDLVSALDNLSTSSFQFQRGFDVPALNPLTFIFIYPRKNLLKWWHWALIATSPVFLIALAATGAYLDKIYKRFHIYKDCCVASSQSGFSNKKYMDKLMNNAFDRNYDRGRDLISKVTRRKMVTQI